LTEPSLIKVAGQLGHSGHRRVFIGFARASDLSAASYPDVLDEETGRGYQRRFAREHSLEFKRYIQAPGATSIPLTFNLRMAVQAFWSLHVDSVAEGFAELQLDLSRGPVMTQVDGQHRIGFLQDSPIEFPFMTFLGLSEQEETDIFRTINGKAKGLSGSLLDFTSGKSLGSDLARASPELFVAIGLNSELGSPWLGKLDLGGVKTVGTKRIASLRTMHQAVRRMVKAARWSDEFAAERALAHAIDFWRAVTLVLPDQWASPRNHMLVKGIGVYALMQVAGHLIQEANGRAIDLDYFVGKLSDFISQIDWSSRGPLEGFGGAKGAEMAFKMIMQVRNDTYRRLSQHA